LFYAVFKKVPEGQSFIQILLYKCRLELQEVQFVADIEQVKQGDTQARHIILFIPT
jgi:hypothetical protein